MSREQKAIDRVNRLSQIINESANIAVKTKNPDTKISRINLAIKHIYAVRDIATQYPFIETKNIDLLDYQLTKMKYEFLKDEFE